MMRRGLVLMIGWGVSLAAADAQAAVRNGATSDAQDQMENLSGPRKPDLAEVHVSYDEAGSVTFAVRFHQPVDVSAQGHRLEVLAASEGVTYTANSGYCQGSDVATRADISASSSGGQTYVSGTEGYASSSVQVSADGSWMTLTTGHPAIAGRDLRCFDAQVYRPDPYGHCGNASCTYISYRYTSDELEPFAWFNGFGPPLTAPSPQCQNGLDDDGDGRADGKDAGCDVNQTEILEKLPRLSVSDAKGYLLTALGRRFRREFRGRQWWTARCRRRTSRVVVRCRVSWASGNVFYWGRTRIWYSRDGDDVAWNYGWRIKRRDEYCQFATRRRDCTRTYVAR